MALQKWFPASPAAQWGTRNIHMDCRRCLGKCFLQLLRHSPAPTTTTETCRSSVPEASPAIPAAMPIFRINSCGPLGHQEADRTCRRWPPQVVPATPAAYAAPKSGHMTCRRWSPPASPAPPAARSTPQAATGVAGDGILKALPGNPPAHPAHKAATGLAGDGLQKRFPSCKLLRPMRHPQN